MKAAGRRRCLASTLALAALSRQCALVEQDMIFSFLPTTMTTCMPIAFIAVCVSIIAPRHGWKPSRPWNDCSVQTPLGTRS